LLERPRSGRVQVAGGRLFHRSREAGAERWSLFVSASLDGPRRPVIDPAALFQGLTPRLADCHPSPDGRLVAFRVAFRGSSLMPLHVVDVATGALLPDRVPGELNPVAHLWHSENQVAWTAAGDGFYYSRASGGSSSDEVRYRQQIYFHRLGDDSADDRRAFGEDLAPGETPIPSLSEDGRFLVVTVHDFTGGEPVSALWVRDQEREEVGFQPVLPAAPGTIGACLRGRWVYLRTNRADARGGVIRVALDAAPSGPQGAEVVVGAPLERGERWAVAGDRVVVERRDDEDVALQVFRDGREERGPVPIGSGASINWMTSTSDGDAVLLGVSCPRDPSRTVRVELPARGPAASLRPSTHAVTEGLQVRRVWFTSRDGTRVPMNLMHRSDLSCDGRAPAVVRGYGGFSVSMRPKYRADVIPFLERGGVYAEPQVRGGGELGDSWHRSGMREQKQNSFDDFNAAAEWLIAEGYAAEGRLGCIGWSNGGLLTMGAALQRPGLWRAVVAGAPVTDMARFHLSDGGRHWMSEYGVPDRDEELEWLLRYSPYHNVPDRIAAPAVLIYAPDADDRVAPWHGRKMLAQWQRATTSQRPVLLRGGPDLGHAGGTTVTRTAERFADIWAFLFWQLGVPLASGGAQA